METLHRGGDELREQQRTDEGDTQEGRRRMEDPLPDLACARLRDLHREPEGGDPHVPSREGDRGGVFDETASVAHHLVRPRVTERPQRQQGRNGTVRFSPLRNPVVGRHDVGGVPDGDEGDVAIARLGFRYQPVKPQRIVRQQGMPRGEGHHAGDRGAPQEQVAAQGGLGHLRDRPDHGDDQEDDEGKQESEQFQADPYPIVVRSPRAGLFFFRILSMAVLYYYRRSEAVRESYHAVVIE